MDGLPIRRKRFIIGFITGRPRDALWYSSACSLYLARFVAVLPGYIKRSITKIAIGFLPSEPLHPHTTSRLQAIHALSSP